MQQPALQLNRQRVRWQGDVLLKGPAAGDSDTPSRVTASRRAWKAHRQTRLSLNGRDPYNLVITNITNLKRSAKNSWRNKVGAFSS